LNGEIKGASGIIEDAGSVNVELDPGEAETYEVSGHPESEGNKQYVCTTRADRRSAFFASFETERFIGRKALQILCIDNTQKERFQ
jgi:hypothetical protein